MVRFMVLLASVIALLLCNIGYAASHPPTSSVSYNVVNFGAKPDGKTESTQAFLRAWASACRSLRPATVYVPKGNYLLKAVVFNGPCKNRITVRIDGTLVAPTDYWALGNSGYWILFSKVDRISVIGGKIDAKGAGFWACRNSRKNCPVVGARSMTFKRVNGLEVNGLQSLNSQTMHLVINHCKNVVIRNVRIIAPDKSPNTDGIHVQHSTGITITSSSLKTGDDCVSIGPGTTNMFMDRLVCGPGHGISIGSLGRFAVEVGVQNVTLINSLFVGSQNGIRIKSWARPSTGFVKNINYRNIVMKHVKNPIIIDQNYCPNNIGCPKQTSGIKISGVTYKNIQGTSKTKVAMTFDCSPSQKCRGIKLQDIKLKYYLNNQKAQSTCKNIQGTTTGVILPYKCL
ncbi:PREDICTED: polygalacturonase-like [Ipomoea nil]|uniref:polygalacturonase-like n=1 Tax=Ipomoea nil TaxID=35883 RepID=UPI000901511F|nr:PREDICTED: polygalacturonase-like [Ipomoea nil]